MLLDEELMPAELPTTGAGADGEVISSEALEAATILCGAGQEDLVYRVRPRRLVDALGATVSVIHAEGVGQGAPTRSLRASIQDYIQWFGTELV